MFIGDLSIGKQLKDASGIVRIQWIRYVSLDCGNKAYVFSEEFVPLVQCTCAQKGSVCSERNSCDTMSEVVGTDFLLNDSTVLQYCVFGLSSLRHHKLQV